jgi:hypothetical protein
MFFVYFESFRYSTLVKYSSKIKNELKWELFFKKIRYPKQAIIHIKKTTRITVYSLVIFFHISGDIPLDPAVMKTSDSGNWSPARTCWNLSLLQYNYRLLSTWFPMVQSVLRIHDILVWIRIRGSMRLTDGSGSFYFHYWPSRCQQKTNFFKEAFLHITFWRYFNIIFLT